MAGAPQPRFDQINLVVRDMKAMVAFYGILGIEVTREIATLALLAAAACASGRTGRERVGLFGFTFALWDLSYYVYLVVWIGFPRSLGDTDLYFLVPIAWYGPVGPTRGKARVLIDGKAVKVVNLQRSGFEASTILYTVSWKSAGRHTFEIEVIGTPGHKLVAIDELVVTE